MKTKIFYLFIGMLIFSSSFLFCEPEPVEPSGSGTAEDPFLISSLENLYWLTQNSDHWDKHYEQTADIDAEDSENWDEGEGFTPIGNTADTSFTGIYDGNDYKIENIYINRPGNHYQGLFGFTYGAEIKNLCAVNVNIKGYKYVGGLTGRDKSSNIINCCSSGTVYAYYGYAGGIAGRTENSEITDCNSEAVITAEESCSGGITGFAEKVSIANCYSTGAVTAKYGNAGGITGYLGNNSSILYCYSTGNIFAKLTVGGIAGEVVQNSTIKSCFSYGDCEAENRFCGGIAGYVYSSTIADCYSANTISTFVFCGGINGVSHTSEVLNCYFTGYVNSSSYCGGISGETTLSSISNCFSIGLIDTYSYRKTGSITGSLNESVLTECYFNSDYYSMFLLTNGAVGITTAEMTKYCNSGTDPSAVYENWDFYDAETNPDGIWAVDETHGGYPYLKKLADLFGTNTLTLNTDGNGSAYGSGKYNIGSSALIHAESNNGYYFVNWYQNSNTVLSENTSYLHQLNGNETIYADFDVFPLSGYGTEENPYLISSLDDIELLLNYSEHWDKHFRQTANIDASPAESWNDGTGFIPLGTIEKPFKGVYNGNNYEIQNIYINGQDIEYQGIFGYIYNAEIKNLKAENVNVTGKDFLGSIVGFANNSTIANCSSTGAVKNNYSDGRVGGIVGEAAMSSYLTNCFSSSSIVSYRSPTGGIAGIASSSTTITNSYFTGTINTNGKNAGGIAAIVKNNCEITNCYSTGGIVAKNSNAGGISSVINNSKIINCYSIGTIYTYSSYAGGIAAVITDDSIIKYCYSAGTITAEDYHAGGITASSSQSTISSCYSTGIIKARYHHAGGISSISKQTTINNCYSLSSLISDENIGAISINTDDETVLNNCYANSDFYFTEFINNGAIGKTTSEMTLYGNDGTDPTNVYIGWDFYDAESNPDGVWAIDETHGGYPYLKKFADLFGTNTLTVNSNGNGSVYGSGKYNIGASAVVFPEAGAGYYFVKWYNETEANLSEELAFNYQLNGNETLFGEFAALPFSGSGTEENPFLISTFDDLNLISVLPEHWSKYFKQTANIDASDSKNINNGKGFKPIGTDSYNAFTGSYDGAGYEIRNIYINNPAADNQGIFGFTDGAELKNLSAVNVDVNGYSYVGGIVGREKYSNITNCYSSGTVNASYYCAGGICGWSLKTDFSKCGTSAAVDGHSHTGGTAGYTDRSTVSKCYSNGTISSYYNAGGITGRALNSEITNCHTSGTVSSYKWVGGIVGQASTSPLANCFSVSEIDSDIHTGGIAGHAEELTITNCFFAGKITNHNYSIEAIAPDIINTEVVDCYVNTDFCRETLVNHGAAGKTTAEMTLYGNNGADPSSVYENWDFYDSETNPDGVWAVDETYGGYPYLKKLADLFGTNTLTVIADGNGSAYGSGKYNIGASAAVYAEPDEDWLFIKWYSDADTSLFDEQAYLHTLESDEILYAKFDENDDENDDDNLIYTYSLSQNKPNPFNPSTVIKYSIPEDSFVQVEVYNILGRKVKTLVSNTKNKGEYSVIWNGRDTNGEKVASGVYFYRIINRGDVITKKMLLMK